MYHEFILNTWIRFSIFATSVHASHTYITLESTRYLNMLCLVRKPMLLLHTLLPFDIAVVSVAILMGICALQVPYLDKVAPYLKCDTSSCSSPSMVMLALLLFMLFKIQLYISVLTTGMLYALPLAPSDFVRYCSSLVLPHHIYVVCKTEGADEPVTNWNGCVLSWGSRVWLSQGKNISRTGESKPPYLTSTGCPENLS